MSLPLLCNSTDDEICGRDMELIELHKKIQPVGKRQPHGFALRRNHNQTALPLFFGVPQWVFAQDINTDWLVTQLGDQPLTSQWICLKPQRLFFFTNAERGEITLKHRGHPLCKPMLNQKSQDSSHLPMLNQITSLASCSFLNARHIKKYFSAGPQVMNDSRSKGMVLSNLGPMYLDASMRTLWLV